MPFSYGHSQIVDVFSPFLQLILDTVAPPAHSGPSSVYDDGPQTRSPLSWGYTRQPISYCTISMFPLEP